MASQIVVQPIGVLIGIAIGGIFIGIGSAIGGAIVEIWLKPHLIEWKNRQVEKKAMKFIKDAIMMKEEK